MNQDVLWPLMCHPFWATYLIKLFFMLILIPNINGHPEFQVVSDHASYPFKDYLTLPVVTQAVYTGHKSHQFACICPNIEGGRPSADTVLTEK